MHAADDRSKVMLAMRLEADVAQTHDFVVTAGLLESAFEVFARIVVVAGKPFLIGAHHARRRGAQAFAIRIVAGPLDERADGGLRLLARRTAAFRRFSNLEPRTLGARTLGTHRFVHFDFSGSRCIERTKLD